VLSVWFLCLACPVHEILQYEIDIWGYSILSNTVLSCKLPRLDRWQLVFVSGITAERYTRLQINKEDLIKVVIIELSHLFMSIICLSTHFQYQKLSDITSNFHIIAMFIILTLKLIFHTEFAAIYGLSPY
jgi:hypothetical protein